LSVIHEAEPGQLGPGVIELVRRQAKDSPDRRTGIVTPAVFVSDDNQEEVEGQGFMGELLQIPPMKEPVINDGIAFGPTHGVGDTGDPA